MVRVAAERLGHDPVEFLLDLVRSLARRQPGAVADAKDMRVDREGFFAPCGVEDDVRGLATDSGQRLQLFPRSWNVAAVLIDERAAQGDDVLRLGVE